MCLLVEIIINVTKLRTKLHVYCRVSIVDDETFIVTIDSFPLKPLVPSPPLQTKVIPFPVITFSRSERIKSFSSRSLKLKVVFGCNGHLQLLNRVVSVIVIGHG